MLELLEADRKSKGTLFILGDFFDFWFDKNDHIPHSLEPVIDALKAIIDDGIEIHYVGGNHDFWVEGYLTKHVGIRFYPDALQFETDGKKVYCEHGDHSVYPNEQYPWIRKLIRDPLAIALLKLLPINWTYKLGESVSHYNQDIPDTSAMSRFLVNKMRDYLKSKLNDGYDIAISGHVHSPFIDTIEGKTLAILGDWIGSRSYGYMDEGSFRLING